MKEVNLIFPHQLYESNALLENGKDTYLIEEFLFFKQYKFHKQKIAFHRATMKAYEKALKNHNLKVFYVEANDPRADIRNFNIEIKAKNIQVINYIDPTDQWLDERIQTIGENCSLNRLESPQFLNTTRDLAHFFKPSKKFYFQTTFYKQERKKRKILIDDENKPTGGKWTFDQENRKKFPKGKIPPPVRFPNRNKAWTEAYNYTEKNFKDNPGTIAIDPIFPISHHAASQWLDEFLINRFAEFGPYEDAIVKEHLLLNHSLLSPLINIGLLLPNEVVQKLIAFASREEIQLNSVEGIIRQIIGWREFVRGMYECKGTFSRTRNFWNFNRKIPSSFYDGTTGIIPVDETIKKVLKTGYCHHIERLMILGNFMLLCEFNPNEVYRWFMEMFIDAYDWVMVPNVYGMSQFADGGTFATKPYISSSNYIKKMSNYKEGSWEAIWDGLFWRFIAEHQGFFKNNPRSSMMVHTLNKMEPDKQKLHFERANNFINNLNE